MEHAPEGRELDGTSLLPEQIRRVGDRGGEQVVGADPDQPVAATVGLAP